MSTTENFGRAELALIDALLTRDAPSVRERVMRLLRCDTLSSSVRPVLQDWVMRIPMMQQTVLLTAIRGPDGMPKYGPVKMLMRWYRRCVLLSAIDGKVLSDPYSRNGGSFTGPSFDVNEDWPLLWEPAMNKIVDQYLQGLDAVPHHFHMHFMHAVEILGYKYPFVDTRRWWSQVYLRFVNDMHLHPETEEELDKRLGDTREGWLERADPATTE